MLIAARPLAEFIADVFRAAGCSADESRRIAENLVDANLTGHDSHGVIRTPRYVKWLQGGKLVADQTVTVVADTGPMLILDGNYGFGQTVGPEAVARGIERAGSLGVAVVALRHAGHLGRIGAWAEVAAAEGLVSIHFVNVHGSLLVAPYGGVERRIGTNPVTIGVPRPDAPPVILDFATSEVAEGKILVAAKGGKPLPEGCLIGPEGEFGNDPLMLYGDSDPAVTPERRAGPGAIRAFGAHKGSGLALMCELLAGALTRSGATGPDRDRVFNGMLSVYLAAEAFDTDGGFGDEVRAYLEFFRSARPAGGGEVLTPGEPERRARLARLRDGVPLADEAWASLCAVATELGVAVPTP